MALISSWKTGVSPASPALADPTCSLLKMFLDLLTQDGEDSRVLDVGPICGQNIDFWLQRIHKLYVFDVHRNLFESPRETISGIPPRRRIDFPDACVNGILCWDLCDLLEDTDVSNFVSQCRALLRPNGVLSLFTFAEQAMPSANTRFEVRSGFRLSWHPRTGPKMIRRYRPNREVLDLLSPLTPLKSLIYRNGLREFLFQRD